MTYNLNSIIGREACIVEESLMFAQFTGELKYYISSNRANDNDSG
jgi:hypothetical protein